MENAPNTPNISNTTNPTAEAKKDNRKLVLQAIALLVVIAVIIIIGIATSRNSSTPSTNPNSGSSTTDHGDIEESLPATATATLDNTYIVYQAFGDSATSTILETIRNLAITDAELASAPSPSEDNSYTITIDDNSLTRKTESTYTTYTFDFNVNDGRAYKAYLRRENARSSYYYALVIQRLTPAANSAYLSITFIISDTVDDPANSTTTQAYDRTTVINTFTDWAKSLNLGTLTLTVTDPTE